MLLHACAAAVWVISLLGGAAAAAELEGELAHRLEAIVRIHADVPAEARTSAYLGTTRDGAGVVIDDAGLVVTIGYLITEAMGAEVTAANGRVSRADIVGFDIASGLGLLRAAEPLGVKPMPIGSAQCSRTQSSPHRPTRLGAAPRCSDPTASSAGSAR